MKPKFFDAYINNDQVNIVRGVLLKVFSCLCFAILNALFKYSTVKQGQPVLQITFMQNIFGALFAAPFIVYKANYKIKFPQLHLFRLFCTIFGNVTFQCSIFLLPIAHVVSLAFIGPLVNVTAAYVFLKEPMSKRVLASIIFSFVAGLLIVRPYEILFNHNAFEYNAIYLCLPLVASLFFAGSTLSSRVLTSNGQSAAMLSFYQMLCSIPVLAIPAIYVWHPLSWDTFCIYVAIGLLSALAFVSWNKAYSLVRVNHLSPWGFTRLCFTMMIGAYFFGDEITPLLLGLAPLVILVNIVLLKKR